MLKSNDNKISRGWNSARSAISGKDFSHEGRGNKPAANWRKLRQSRVVAENVVSPVAVTEQVSDGGFLFHSKVSRHATMA